MFSSPMPQRKAIFELLAAPSDRVVAAANATLRLMNGLGDDGVDLRVRVAELNMNEHGADEIENELITLLHRSFTTPIKRDQIHASTIERDEQAAWHAMTMRRFHFRQAKVLDRCRRTARTIEDILIGNA